MDNYDKVLKYTNETMNASGTSAEKYQHYMDSLEATINGLQVQWEQFIQELDATDTFKNAIKFVSSLLSVLDALVNKVPVLQTLLGAFVGFKVIKGIVPTVLKMASAISKFKGLGSSIKTLANSFKNLKAISTPLSDTYTEMGTKLSVYQQQQITQIATNKELDMTEKERQLTALGLSAAQTQLILRTDEQTRSNVNAILSNTKLTMSQKQGKIASILLAVAKKNNIVLDKKQAISLGGAIAKQKTMTYTTEGLTAGMTALNLILGTVAIAASLAFSIIMKVNQEAEQSRDNAIDAADAYNEQASSMEELMERYKELKEELDKTQDLDAQKEITSEILDIRNQVIDSYGAEATKIDFINGQLNETLGLWQQINQEQAQETYVKNKNEYQKALDYAESSGYWNYFDFSSKKLHGKTTDILSRQWSWQQGDFINLLKGIGIEGVEAHSGFGVTPSYRISGENVFDTYNKLVEISLKIQKELEHNSDLTDDEKRQLSEFQADVITEINAYDKDENFTKNKQLYESAQQSVIDAMGVFKTNTGELVSPSALYDLYTGAIEDLNTLSANFDFGNQEMVNNWNKTVEDISKYQDYLQQLYDQTTDETQKGYLKKIIANLEKATKDATQKVSAENYISGQISGQTDLIKKINDLTTEELVASQDEQIVGMFENLQSELKAQGIVMSIEEIAQAISDLGYTYKETEKITAAGLIENFSTDESEIKTITENIEKLNNAVKTVVSGGTLDLEDLSDLRDAGIDVSALVEGGIDNITEISKLRDDYIQSVLDGLDEKIKIYNEVMKQDKDITEEEKRQIELETKMIELRKETIQSAAEGIKTTANEYITALKSANEIMAQAQAYGNSTISEDILSSMVEQYADMAGYVEKYRLGMIDNDELLDAFNEFYQNDINNYQDYQNKKYKETSEYFQQWLEDNEDWVKDFKEKYDIDLRQYKTYTEAKAGIEKKYKRMQYLDNEHDIDKYTDEAGNLTNKGKEFLALSDNWAKPTQSALKEYVTLKKEWVKISEGAEELDEKYASDTEDVYIDMTESIDARLTTITDRMQNAYGLLYELQSNSSQLTIENLNDMKSAYPAMSEYIDKYLRKEMSRAELISKFKEMYEQDKNNYIKAQQEKLTYSEDFYKNVILGNQKLVDKFNEQYHIDLKNFATITAAKQAILNAFNDENAAGFELNIEDYIDLATGEYTSAFNAILTGEHIPTGGLWLMPYVQALHDILGETEKAATETADGITGAIKDAVYSIEDALSDVSTILSGQVDYWEQITNGIVAAAQLEIDALDKEIDLLEKKNEEQQRQIDLQEKLEALNRAKTQRNVREYNAETGQFEWTTNKKNIETAQREYDEALQEDEIKSKEAAKEWYEKYGESFSNVSSTIETQRQINQALQLLASMRGVDVNTLSYKDLLNMTDEEQAAIRSKYGSAVDTNLAFEDAQNQQNINKAKTNLVTGGYATNGANGFVLDYNALSNAIGVPLTKLASGLSGYTEILKSTSFAETKPTTSTVNNITNTGAVTNSYVLSGDMTFKFDGNMDVDGFITQLATKLDEKIAITPLS